MAPVSGQPGAASGTAAPLDRGGRLGSGCRRDRGLDGYHSAPIEVRFRLAVARLDWPPVVHVRATQRNSNSVARECRVNRLRSQYLSRRRPKPAAPRASRRARRSAVGSARQELASGRGHRCARPGVVAPEVGGRPRRQPEKVVSRANSACGSAKNDSLCSTCTCSRGKCSYTRRELLGEAAAPDRHGGGG